MKPRTNVLLIMTDQQRFDTIRSLGNPFIYTPNLDWLAEGGTHFSRCYADAPVCCPSRATCITGTHYSNMPTGVGGFGEPTTRSPNLTLPAVMTAAGYQTKAVGKLHYHPPRANYGWEDAEILEDYYRLMQRHPEHGRPADHGLGQNQVEPALSTVHESHSLTQWVAGQSIDFLETRDPTRPFFLYTSFSKPHPPFDPCRNFWELYRDRPVPEPVVGDWSSRAEHIPPGWMHPTWQLNAVDTFSPHQIADMRRAYYALITQIDYALGLLFARLRELQLLDNTLILFTSDHGEMLGDHHMGAKSLFLEPSARVPLIVRPPHNEAMAGGWWERIGGRCDRLVCLADIYATVTAAAGVDVPADAAPDSINLLDAADGSSPRERLFGQLNAFHCVIEERFKYLFTENGGAELLFDLQADPQERTDLKSTPEHARTLARLRQLLNDRLRGRQHPAAGPVAPISVREPTSRQFVRAHHAWPGHHHPAHTRDDILH